MSLHSETTGFYTVVSWSQRPDCGTKKFHESAVADASGSHPQQILGAFS